MIDATELLAVVDIVVEKRGEDWRYPNWKDVISVMSEEEYDNFWLPEGCHYMWDGTDVEAGEKLGLDLVVGQPACLVGAVLAELNLLDLVDEEDDNGSAVNGIDGLEAVFDEKARRLLITGQSVQDKNETWGRTREAMWSRLREFGD